MGNYLKDLGIDSTSSRDYEQHEKIHCTDVYHAHQHHRLWEEAAETYILALAHVHGSVSFPNGAMPEGSSGPKDMQTAVASDTIGPLQGPQPPIDMVVDAVIQCIHGMVVCAGVGLGSTARMASVSHRCLVCMCTITAGAFRPYRYSDGANGTPALAVNMGVFLALWLEETARFCMHHNDGETLAAVFRMCWPVHCGTMHSWAHNRKTYIGSQCTLACQRRRSPTRKKWQPLNPSRIVCPPAVRSQQKPVERPCLYHHAGHPCTIWRAVGMGVTVGGAPYTSRAALPRPCSRDADSHRVDSYPINDVQNILRVDVVGLIHH